MLSRFNRQRGSTVRVAGSACALLAMVAAVLAYALPVSAQERRNSDPEFLHASYDLSIAENAAVGAAVGTVPATDFNDDALTYTITAGNGDGKFAINGGTGTVTVAAALDHETTSSYALTVQADDGYGGTAIATANITVTACTASEEAPAPAAVTVDAVPIVVASTTDDYFVLYVSHRTTTGATVEWPVAVTLGEAGTTTLSENVEALPAERYRVERYQVSDPADLDGDCVDDITELGNLGAMSPVNRAKPLASKNGALAIPDWSTFDSMARDQPGGQQYLKFHVTGMDTNRPAIHFMNTNTHAHHWKFLQAIGAVYHDDHDAYHGRSATGEVIYAPKLTAPDGSRGVYYWRIAASQYRSVETTTRVHTLLASGLGLVDDDLAVHIRSYMLPYLQSTMPSLRESRVPLLFDHDVFGDTDYAALNTGEGFGRLRQLDADDRPHPRDIVIYEALPNELPPVAGMISTVPQTPLSHLNLRAVQNGVPNAYARDVLEDADVLSLMDEYVRLEVTETGYSVRAATPEEVEAHYESSRPHFVQVPRRDLSVRAITPLGSVGFDDWDAFGVKAANLAVLRTLGLPEGTVPDGFAVPFYFYDEFMKANGLYADIREMLAGEDFQTDYDVQETELKALRKKIKRADTPRWIIDALEAMHDTFPEGQSLRYRSSTNNEDLPGFNGAGLYDSKTQKPGETVEDGIDKSLKQVYASLWNFRAFSERELHRVDHLASAMGVLVHPNYSDEKVNGVAVSFDPLTGATDDYYVNSQLGEDLVTNPEAYSIPEELLLRQNGHHVRSLSNLVEPGEMLLSITQMDQLREHLRTIRSHFEGLYGPDGGEQFAMEIEFKITSEGVLAIKQARPWVFPGAHQRTPPVSALSATATDHSVTVSWELAEPPEGVYVYEMHLERLDAGGGVVWSELVEEEPYAGAHQHTVYGLDPATEYRFRVRLDAEEHGDAYSQAVSITTQADAPVAPTGLSAVAAAESVTLNWEIPAQPAWLADGGFVDVLREMTSPRTEAEHRVNRASDPMVWQRGKTSWQFTDTSVYPGYTYRYRIRTYLAATHQTSDYVEVTTPSLTIDPDAAPGGATALDVSSATRKRQYYSRFYLDGGGGDRVDYFTFTTDARYQLGLGVRGQRIDLDVYLEDADGVTVAQSWPPPPDATVEWIKAVIDPGTYYIRVRAAADHSTGYYIRLGLADPPAVAMAPPTGLAVAAVTATSATLGWTVPAQPDGVTVRGVYVERGGPDGSFDRSTLVNGTGTGEWTWTDEGLSEDVEYRYRVRLSTTAGEAHTNTVTVNNAG